MTGSGHREYPKLIGPWFCYWGIREGASEEGCTCGPRCAPTLPPDPPQCAALHMMLSKMPGAGRLGNTLEMRPRSLATQGKP